MSKKIQLAKVYRSGAFMGYAVAVDGELVECQASTAIATEPGCLPTLTAEFHITEEHAENPIRIEV